MTEMTERGKYGEWMKFTVQGVKFRILTDTDYRELTKAQLQALIAMLQVQCDYIEPEPCHHHD